MALFEEFNVNMFVVIKSKMTNFGIHSQVQNNQLSAYEISVYYMNSISRIQN